MTHGIKLADGTFIENGTIGKSGNRIELSISNEEAAKNLLSLMDYEKTKWIGFYVNRLINEYIGYSFIYMQRDETDGRIQVWLEKLNFETEEDRSDVNDETGIKEETEDESEE